MCLLSHLQSRSQREEKNGIGLHIFLNQSYDENLLNSAWLIHLLADIIDISYIQYIGIYQYMYVI